MCTVNEESTASETDLAPGREEAQFSQVPDHGKKRWGSTFPDCSQLHLFMQPKLCIQ